MKDKCSTHPDEDAMSICHSCGKYFCANCLSTGREYYYCKNEKCQLLFSDEVKQYQLDDDRNVTNSDQRWKQESKRFYKNTIRALFVLWILLTVILFITLAPEYHEGSLWAPLISFCVCGKWFIIIYLIRTIIYKHFFWKKRLLKELSRETEGVKMPKRELNQQNLGHDEDWVGNAAAFKCPHCSKVFIVSGTRIHSGVRKCPECGKSTGRCDIEGAPRGGKASLEW